jgi:peptidoglycan/LPS O-acetylase OafA/YrhL
MTANVALQETKTPIAPAKSGTPHLWQLDVLRAAAILIVFCYHLLGTSYGTFELYGTNPGGHWNVIPTIHDRTLWIFYPFSLGQSGVVLFFVLSGFCIHHSILQSHRKAMLQGQDSPVVHYGAFMWRRAWRILPAYFVALVGFFVLQRVLEHQPGERLFKGIGDFAWHALMIHNLRPATFQSINPSFWSLGVEWQFYLIYPIFLLLRRGTGIKMTILITAIISIATQVFVSFKNLQTHPEIETWNAFPLITWFNWCLGALIAEYWDRGQRFFRLPTIAVLGLWALLLVFAGYDQDNDFVAGITGMAWPTMFAVTLEMYIHVRRPAMRWERAVIPIGLCSYSLYLLHQPLLGPLLNAMHRWLHLPAIHWVDLTFIAVLMLGVLVAISWLSYRWIETPGTKLGHRFAAVRRNR